MADSYYQVNKNIIIISLSISKFQALKIKSDRLIRMDEHQRNDEHTFCRLTRIV